MSGSKSYSLVDRIVGGDLASRLQSWRGDGLSYAAITKRLLLDHDIDVSIDTVRRWCDQEKVA